MDYKIGQKPSKKNQLYIIDDKALIAETGILSAPEAAYATGAFDKDTTLVSINQYDKTIYIYFLKPKKTDWQTAEAIRKTGSEVCSLINKQKAEEVSITNLSANRNAAYLLAEGAVLANYQFIKYRSEAVKITNSFKKIIFTGETITPEKLDQLRYTCEAIYHARTLVNEPPNILTAEQLANEIADLGKEAGFKVTTMGRKEIEKEKMGGILAVNAGSILPPSFSIMEYKPKKAVNSKPVVLVGKGIVYDTGGLSLKPTANSMDRMKSDMSGAALVSGAMYTIAKLKLPLHIIALVPATDNRPGENAYTPGDIITMYSGSTVEVLNTDAEGRLVLADALHWAKRYNPELVIDFATLTGAAAVAVGEQGIVCMGTAEGEQIDAFKESGYNQYERLVEYPLWDEYGELIKSEYADLKNVGGPYGGAITAGKFLQHFTDYPWMHFDIAGVSFATAKKNYITPGGTAFGLRMLVDFLMNYSDRTED